ncbi:MAG TPA: YicC/YloC family endoribonuclease [Candidatus Methylomirabilis sp.]|nr:YicC/YloC family endoribonuclease [Candidatus Methylomirabilis sp.]
MIRSMTGYGRAEATGARLLLSIECKSVNHRHLDVALKLPRAINAVEADARRLVQSAVTRGRIDVSVSLNPIGVGALTSLSMNLTLAKEYAEVRRQLKEALELEDRPSLEWVLEQPGVIVREAEPTISAEETWPLLEQALSRALDELLARREAEGAALAKELLALHEGLSTHVEAITARAPAAVDRRAARLRSRIQSLVGDTTLDEGRIATEVAVWAEKTDISEELARLRAHLDQFALLVQGGGPVGRTLDFLAQEMNREVNTVGSKADDLEISQAVIAAKSALEKLREQAQNIE